MTATLHNLKLAIFTLLGVVLLLLSGRLIWGLTNELFFLLTGGYAVTVGVFLIIKGNCVIQIKHLSTLLLACTFAIMGLLAAIYTMDRGGWNWYLVTGYDVTIAETYDADRFLNRNEFVARHPSFKLDEDAPHKIWLRQGVHTFDETVVVPGGLELWLEPGVAVNLGSGRSLLSYSPIVAVGSERLPIRFQASYTLLKWGAIAVIGEGNSVFEHVQFENGRRAAINGLDLVAGLNIVEGNVEIRHCSFTNMFGKDAVNVKFGHAMVAYNLFRDIYKDGIDLDATSGEISYNEFINCEDEGIDLSENVNVVVQHNRIFDRHGGRVAADNDLEQIKDGNTFGYTGR